MPIYEYKCDTCDTHFESKLPNRAGSKCPAINPDAPVQLLLCFGTLKRVFSFVHQRSMPEHFNHTVNKVVSSNNQFKDELKRKSEEASIRTGIDHNFVPVHPSEQREVYGITSEGLDSTYDRANPNDKTGQKRKVIQNLD